MYALFTALLALAISITAHAAPLVARVSSSYIDITDLHLRSVQNGNDTLHFTINNPEPTGNGPTTCSGSWPHGEAAGKNLLCGRSYTASITSTTAYNDFTLHLSNWFHDPSVGQPDVVTAFANTDVKPPAIECYDQSNNATSLECCQPSGTVIHAPITSMIAKK